jgi:hypothetical protein
LQKVLFGFCKERKELEIAVEVWARNVFNRVHNNILKKRLQTKHCVATPRKGSTARVCVSAIVLINQKKIENNKK